MEKEVYALSKNGIKKVIIRTPKNPFTNRLVLGVITLLILSNILTGIHLTKVRAQKETVNCSSFKTHQEAQKYYDTKQKGYYNLYADKNGIVCKTLSWE